MHITCCMELIAELCSVTSSSPNEPLHNFHVTVYLQVKARAYEVWGGEEGLKEAHEKKSERREKKREKKFAKEIKGLHAYMHIICIISPLHCSKYLHDPCKCTTINLCKEICLQWRR